ncbi:Ankyrin repeat-containing domain protein [Cordyceps fumosorosea ARSEF 2679]|uniref:Ankyrin repeat-containing domain protein n=1 Tax=Cordyceps fumosorosea (strain ARSEF 2679) TaxID=1081104 RepID=A0A168E7L7_CORFA|nr:Ankyrin repeat-containing domain protein [Cordyceps fumosorosea ARSEF 2679]OAA73470.1 Ankyrin repeat-containing domain protein [Cordyceps fumosorosea ARSEF 2679]
MKMRRRLADLYAVYSSQHPVHWQMADSLQIQRTLCLKQTSFHDLEIVAPAVLSPPHSRRSSENLVNGQQASLGECTEELTKRFLAALEVDDPMLDISRLAGWMTHIPERLGANELLDKAASAFLDAFDCLQSDTQFRAASPAYTVAMECLEPALKDQNQIKSPNPLAAIFMLSMTQAMEEYWGDTFAQSVRLNAIRIVCVESIINPSLALDSRCLQSIRYEAAPYPPLDDEDGQAIESLDIPFLLRLSHLLRAPDEHREEIRNSYARLKVEWPFTSRRYRYIAGIGKITGIDRSCLVQPEAQLGIAHTVVLAAALVLNACLLAMDPGNVGLEREALEVGHEAVETSQKLLQGLPKGVWFAPVGLFASWIATDDPDITCSFFSIIKECNQYWAEPTYMELAKTLKKRILQLRANAVMEQSPRGFRDFVALKLQCSAEMICQILDRGADLDTIVLMWQETYDVYLMPEPHPETEIPLTPLEWAIEHQRMDLVDLFLERGADINFAGYPQHGPPLVTAVLRRNLALVRRLAGKTERCAATRALCLAVEQEDRLMVDALLASSVRCEYEDPKWPQRREYYGGIFGPDARLNKDSHFTPPLARAVRLGNLELVRLLLAHGADPNVAYHNICRGHPRQADPELHLPRPQYACGRPVYLAAELKFDAIVEVLIRGGADVHLQHPRAVEVQGPFEYYMPHKCSVAARSVHLDVVSRLEVELYRVTKNKLER